MTTAATPYISLNRSAATHPLSIGGGVPSSRVIACTSPLLIDGGASADLSANRTLSLITSPASQVPVGVTRLITATFPMLIGGGASADLSADRVISMHAFDGSNHGYVVKNSSILGYFLRDDGSWQQGTIAGVSSIVAGTAISVSGPTGAVTINVIAAGISNPGFVPAIGSVDATYFLCKTNPPTWVQVPSVGSVITLQVSSPGTPDVGNENITGTIIGKAGMFGTGSATGASGNPDFPSACSLAVQSSNDANAGLILMQSSGTSGNNQFWMRKTRGTIAAPTATQANDLLGNIVFIGRGSGGASNTSAVIESYADGAPAASQPGTLDLIAGDLDNTKWTTLRATKAGVIIFNGATDLSKRALHTLDVQGSLGLKTTLVPYSGGGTFHYAIADTDGPNFIVDATGGNIQFDLVSAIGRLGREYTFVRVDSTGNVAILAPNGAEQIGGTLGVYLQKANQSITLVSDGSNWQIKSDRNSPACSSQLADASTLSNSAADTDLRGFAYFNITRPGATLSVKALGKFSTTGTPTLRFRLKDATGTNTLADSGAITMPNGVTDAIFEIEVTWVVRSLSGGGAGATIRPVKAVLRIANGSGVFTQYTMAVLAPAVITATSSAIHIWAQWGTANASNAATLIETLVETQPSSDIT